jgi:hypothetical protein
VVLWVGGGIAIVLMALRLKSSGAQMADFARNIE